MSYTIQHPKFSLKTYDFDFSLFKFETPLTFDRQIKAVKLPKEGDILKPGTNCKVSGFGITEDGDVSNDLKSAEVKIIDGVRCKSNFEEVDFNLTSQMLCAGEDNPKKKDRNRDSCAGDSVNFIGF